MKPNKLTNRYYTDLLNDDFAGTHIKQVQIPENYKYIHKNIFYRIGEFIIYWIVAKPLVWLYTKISVHQKFVNRRVIKLVGKEGYFLYANHTMIAEDAFIPNMVGGKKNYIIVNPDAVSIKGVKTIVKMLGGLPLPTTLKGARYFLDALNTLTEKGRHITIYPEAHIWTYYTSIRPFNNTSFKYAVTLNKPVFALTNVFKKSKNPLRRKPAVVTYIDGPFYPDLTLNKSEASIKLRNEVYDAMIKRSSLYPKYKYKYDYIKKEED